MCSPPALTTDRLIVIGRGKLIADASVDEFVRRALGGAVQVRSPQAARLRELALQTSLSDENVAQAVLLVHRDA